MRFAAVRRSPRPAALLLLCALSRCGCAAAALCAVRPGPTELSALAGTPAIVGELQARTAAGASPLALLPQAFPFALDDFQLDSLRALHDEQSVVVSAPTGSGKTVCGEIGCYLALCAAISHVISHNLSPSPTICRDLPAARVGSASCTPRR